MNFEESVKFGAVCRARRYLRAIQERPVNGHIRLTNFPSSGFSGSRACARAIS